MNWTPVTEERDQLGESPFWHPGEQRLYWVDIPGREVKRMEAGGAVERWAMPSEPGCIAPLQGGGLMIALRSGLYRAAGWGEALQLVAPPPYEPATTRFNDGKADPLGRFWAGTIYEPKDAPNAALFCFDLRRDHARPEGSPVKKAGNALTGNGIAWSPDARTLYWSDTPRHVIHQWDWDAASNEMRNPRVFRAFTGKPAGWAPGDPGYGGRPDGAAMDVEGNYWCAMFEGQRLLKIAPSGQTLAEIPVPMMCPTMPCFGGPGLRTLFVTSAGQQRPAAELQAFPLSGRVIAAQVDVPGLPVNFVST